MSLPPSAERLLAEIKAEWNDLTPVQMAAHVASLLPAIVAEARAEAEQRASEAERQRDALRAVVLHPCLECGAWDDATPHLDDCRIGAALEGAASRPAQEPPAPSLDRDALVAAIRSLGTVITRRQPTEDEPLGSETWWVPDTFADALLRGAEPSDGADPEGREP